MTIGCADIVPTQIVHRCSDGTIEVFTRGAAASHENLTFVYDESTKTAIVKTTKFSALEVYGTSAYVKLTYDANARIK